MTASDRRGDTDGPGLKRVIGFWGITFYALGGIIGAGIFATIGAIAGRAGVHAPLAFVIAGVPALFAALSYGELVRRLPRAGGEAAYVSDAFKLLWLTRATALGVALSGVVSAATLLVAFAGYFQSVATMSPWSVMIALAGVSVTLAALGVSLSSGVVVAVTLVEVALLALISVLGAGDIAHWPALAASAPPVEGLALGLASSAVLAFFAFVGFEDVVNMAEEVKDAPRILPRALVLAFVVSLALYLCVTAIAVAVVPLETLSGSPEPLAEVVHAQGLLPDWLMTIMALGSIGNGVIIQVNMVSRLTYGLAADGALPAAMGRVSTVTGTPVAAVVLSGALILAFALTMPLAQLAELTGGVILVVFALVQSALIRIKLREGVRPAQRPQAFAIPTMGIVSALVLLAGAFA